MCCAAAHVSQQCAVDSALCMYIKAEAQVLQHAFALIAVAHVTLLARACLLIIQVSAHTGLSQDSDKTQA